ncbi:MAG: FAD/NAD(P)-binding oxidoreductase [Candidatus Limnocylindrales bacterium]
MAGHRTALVLGGGWGGLAVAHRLRDRLPADHRVVVIEAKSTFSLCTSYLWLLSGERERPEEVRRDLSKLARPGIEWVHDEIESIDPAKRWVRTRSGTLEADDLVIALGADLAPEDVPGLAETALNLYSAEDVVRLRETLASFREGRILLLVARTPFKCPAAPYEAALVIDSVLRASGARDRTEIVMCTPEKQPMPVAGPEVGAAISSMLEGRGIDYRPGWTVSSVDAATMTAQFDGETVGFDLLVAVPPHRAPRVLTDAGLTDSSGYVPAHPQTLEILADGESLETRYPGVFVLGDAAAIRLMNGMLLPKAGVFAEGEANVVAENIAARVEGREPRARFDGNGFCYLEVGGGMAAYASGGFYAYPAPRVVLEPPSPEYKRAKQEFERVLETWFAP